MIFTISLLRPKRMFQKVFQNLFLNVVVGLTVPFLLLYTLLIIGVKFIIRNIPYSENSSFVLNIFTTSTAFYFHGLVCKLKNNKKNI